MPIKNPRRKKQIEQFTDKYHGVMSKYHELMEREMAKRNDVGMDGKSTLDESD